MIEQKTNYLARGSTPRNSMREWTPIALVVVSVGAVIEKQLCNLDRVRLRCIDVKYRSPIICPDRVRVGTAFQQELDFLWVVSPDRFVQARVARSLVAYYVWRLLQPSGRYQSAKD